MLRVDTVVVIARGQVLLVLLLLLLPLLPLLPLLLLQAPLASCPPACTNGKRTLRTAAGAAKGFKACTSQKQSIMGDTAIGGHSVVWGCCWRCRCCCYYCRSGRYQRCNCLISSFSTVWAPAVPAAVFVAAVLLAAAVVWAW